MATMMLTSTLRGATGMIPHALPGLHGGRLAYITTAAAVEPWGFAHTMLTRRQLRQLGFRVTELDVSTAAAPDVRSTLSDADCIYVGGGNSFFLLQELRRTGADALLAERIADGIPYIGESAGSVIMSPDIGYCSIMDRTDRAPGRRNAQGLGLTDCHVVPHLGNPTMGQAARLIVERYSTELDLRALTDRQSLLVRDGGITMLQS